jgi:hypothetical protein
MMDWGIRSKSQLNHLAFILLRIASFPNVTWAFIRYALMCICGVTKLLHLLNVIDNLIAKKLIS